MKPLYTTTIALLALTLLGCSAAQPDGDARLKKNIVVDGMNVSAMRVKEAQAALTERTQARLRENTVTLVLPGSSVALPLSALGVSCDVDQAVREAARLRARGGNRQIDVPYAVDETVLRATVASYAAAHERPSQNASVQADPSGAAPLAYVREQAGVDIDEAALTSALLEAAKRGESARLETPFTSVMPERTLETVQQELTLVAQFSTEFSGRSQRAENRVFNIVKAAEAVNGLVLDAGAIFDCNEVLGDRTEENGWKTAPGIRNGRYEDEYGGGVCQVSSTLFNAVLMADLTVTERHPHSWPMGYVDIGRDATISTGGKNFCFINDSGAPIRLFMRVDTEAHVLTAYVYGKPRTDGAHIEIVSEKTGTPEVAEEIVMLDESLPYQSTEVMREPRDGKTSVTYKEYRLADGSLLDRKVIYEDVYSAIDGVTYVSTDLYYGAQGDQPADSPAEASAQESPAVPEKADDNGDGQETTADGAAEFEKEPSAEPGEDAAAA